jgi:hypothetical protein
MTMAIQEVIKNAEAAKNIWREFLLENPEEVFSNWFHLRPASSHITIVSVNEDRYMRGIEVSKTKLKDAIELINSSILGDFINWEKIREIQEFKKGRENNEFPHQARMIKNMGTNKALKNKLAVKNLEFVASELILQEGRTKGGQKIDIVATDGLGTIFFFENKAYENTTDEPKAQAEGYLKEYAKGAKKNKQFEELFRNYPMRPVPEIKKYFAYGVYGYGEKISEFDEAKPGKPGIIKFEE